MGEAKERMLSGQWYVPDDPDLRRDTARGQELCAAYNATAPPTDESRALLTEFLCSVGERVIVRPPFHCDYGYNTVLGDRTVINFGVVVLDAASVRIGTHVLIGPGVCILTTVHDLAPARRLAGWIKAVPVTIGDNAWIGAGAIVCPGVTIGENTVVAAGSVVTTSLPTGVLAAGSPARIVRALEDPTVPGSRTGAGAPPPCGLTDPVVTPSNEEGP